MKQSNERKEKNTGISPILSTTLKLLAISSLTALLLACVNAFTADTIAENVRREKDAAVMEIFPEADESIAQTDIPAAVDELYLVKADGNAIGYTACVKPLGFGGEMEIMVGVDSDGKVVGIKIVSHSETPGLGSRVSEAEHLMQYNGLSGSITAGSDVQVIAGSTISSKAVASGVSDALSVFDQVFDGGAE